MRKNIGESLFSIVIPIIKTRHIRGEWYDGFIDYIHLLKYSLIRNHHRDQSQVLVQYLFVVERVEAFAWTMPT